MLKSASGTPFYPNMLAWFSHGYEAKERIQTTIARRYGFAVSESKSFFRMADKAIYESLPEAIDGPDFQRQKVCQAYTFGLTILAI